MRRQWHWRRIGLGLLAGGLVLSLQPGLVAAAPAPIQTTDLVYREVDSGYMNCGLGLSQKNGPFLKEPKFRSPDVFRAIWRFGGEANQAIPFAWDHSAAKLYLDLNRNQDLTDDPQGVFALPAESGASSQNDDYCCQTFSNVRLNLNTAAGQQRFLFDLSLSHYRRELHGYAVMRSFWEAKITLQNQDWQLGLMESVQGKLGAGEMSFMLLRPWARREELFNNYDGALDLFPYAPQFFYQNQAYRLTCKTTSVDNVLHYRLQWEETTPVLAEVTIAGQYIDRLVATGPYTVVLDQPGPQVKIPAGAYSQLQVSLRQGNTRAYGDANRGPPRTLTATAGTAQSLRIGGPLTNTVSCAQRGRRVALDYQLVGVDGVPYQLKNQDRSKPPRFKILRGDKEIASGAFEFG